MTRWRDAGLFLALSGLWGLSFPAIAVGLDFLPPVLFAAFRYDVAAVVLLAYALFAREDPLPRARNDRLAVAAGGGFMVSGNAPLFVGQQTVPSGVAAILQGMVPIATAIWAFFVLGERLAPAGAAGVLVGFLGVGLVVRPDPANLLAGDTAGRLLVLVQVASVALGGVLVQRADPDLDRVTLVGWAMLVGAVLLHAGSLARGETASASATSPTAVGAVVYLGVASTAVAFLIYFTLLAAHGAFQAGLVSYLVPVVATVVGVVALDEPLDPLALAGFALVAVGFGLLKREAIRGVLRERTAGPPPAGDAGD